MFTTIRDSVNLWWEQVGSGPPIVLIPGRGDSADLFPQLLLDGLTGAGFSVLRMDPRDTGLSGDGGNTYTLSTMANDIVAVLDDAGITRAPTIAVSMGGMITVDLVSQAHQAIITMDDWQAVQDIFTAGTRTAAPARRRKHDYMLKGMIT